MGKIDRKASVVLRFFKTTVIFITIFIAASPDSYRDGLSVLFRL